MSDRRARFRDWPNREASRFIRAAGFGWHVQVIGQGPPILLLHGTAAATHSWRGMMPLLAARFTVIAPDLPGHGFTETPALSRMSLPGMAAALKSLLQTLEIAPRLIVGHSAGAAIALRMVLDGPASPAGLPVGIIGLNAALKPFDGVAGQIFSPLAKLLVGLPLLPELFAWRAKNMAMVGKLLADTGSPLDPEGVALYARIIQDPRHTAAALAMMARWDLKPLIAELPRLTLPLLLLAGDEDRAIPPTVSDDAARLIPRARVIHLPGQGHLGHEQDPAGTAAIIEAFATEVGA